MTPPHPPKNYPSVTLTRIAWNLSLGNFSLATLFSNLNLPSLAQQLQLGNLIFASLAHQN